MKKLGISFALLATVAAITIAVASAATGYAFFGNGQAVSPGNGSATAAQASSIDAPGFGGVNFTVPAGLTVGALSNLATDYKFSVGTCGLGSPRFAVDVTNGSATGSLFFYLGTPPNYNSCPPGVWTASGNLASPANLVDSSQLPGGTFYDTYAAAQARYASYTVTGISLVVDGPNQTAQFDNSQINDTTVTYEPAPTKENCKNGGYLSFTGAGGSPGPFKNQGDCVSFFATSK